MDAAVGCSGLVRAFKLALRRFFRFLVQEREISSDPTRA